MRKMKLIVVFLVGLILGTTIIVTAALVTSANNITFNSNKTDKTNVNDSLNEIYDKLNSGVENCSEPTTSPVISGDLLQQQ